jgi:insulysin
MRYKIILSLLLYSLLSVSASTAEDLALSPYELIENKALTPFLTPSMQKREIAKLRLNNGLKVYLISDAQAKHSAAAVAVKSGSWDDPSAHPGMAHFVEHLLFMGSKAYPTESDFSGYISTHAGMYNAFTATDRTVYIFSINHEGYQVLDQARPILLIPFSVSSIGELQAVDQKRQNIEHDGWRQWMILKETGP